MSDLIDRQAAIDALDGSLIVDGKENAERVMEYLKGINARIKVLPSVQPRPRGMWLPDNRNYYEDRFVCSVCERSYEVDTCMGDPTWDFCPGCGADMREEEQDE